MAKIQEKGKIKIRFFEVELEGSDETLLESVRSAAALANRTPAAKPPMKLITPAAVKVTSAVPTEEATDILEEASPNRTINRCKSIDITKYT